MRLTTCDLRPFCNTAARFCRLRQCCPNLDLHGIGAIPTIEEKRILAKWKKCGRNRKLLPLFYSHKKGINLNLLGYRYVTGKNIYGTGFAHVKKKVKSVNRSSFLIDLDKNGLGSTFSLTASPQHVVIGYGCTFFRLLV